MDLMHRKVIKEHSEYLVQSTDLQVLLPELRKTNIFTKAMLDDIETGAEKLYEMLPKRGPDAFDSFLKVLRNSNYNNVALKLEDATKITNSKVSYCYTMQSDPRGYCLIINNVNFKYEKQRLGSEKDAKGLNNLFEDIGYDVKVVDDQTRSQTLETLEEFSNRDFRNVDSCVVCILSHGKRINNLDSILDVDSDPVYIHEVLYYFNPENCPDLNNKPKMFFVQACRGGIHDYGEEVDAGMQRGYEAIVHAVDCADTMIAYSTLPDNVSMRDFETGSWFCSELIKVIREYGQNMDLQSMMKIVNNNVCKKVSLDGVKQAVSTALYDWYKKLYFNPKSTL